MVRKHADAVPNFAYHPARGDWVVFGDVLCDFLQVGERRLAPADSQRLLRPFLEERVDLGIGGETRSPGLRDFLFPPLPVFDIGFDRLRGDV